MTYFIRKIHVAITFLLMTSIGYAYGDYSNSSACGESENCCSCQPTCCGGKGFISAELLYWRAFEDGLDTCVPSDVSDSVTSDGRVISRFRGRGRDPDFRWDPGFRVGTGYELACSNWGVAAFWTHFHSRAHDSRNHGNSYRSYGYDYQNHGNERRWNINFDVIDVVAAYESDMGSCFTVRPFGGLRGARIDQKQRLGDFSSSRSDFSNSISSYTSNDFAIIGTKNKEKFWGLGPLIGLEGDWNIGCGLSLYASASVSWLYGHFDVSLTELEESVDFVDFCHVSKHLDAVVGAFDAALGIRWQKCFCSNMRVILQLGLEHHRYFDYNRMGCYGDLSFDGVNFGAAIEF